MENQFYEQPILNSPYEYPSRYSASLRSRLLRAAEAPSSSRRFQNPASAKQHRPNKNWFSTKV